MQIKLDISKTIKSMKIFRFLKYLICSILMVHYIIPVKDKSIGQLETEYQAFKVLTQLFSI